MKRANCCPKLTIPLHDFRTSKHDRFRNCPVPEKRNLSPARKKLLSPYETYFSKVNKNFKASLLLSEDPENAVRGCPFNKHVWTIRVNNFMHFVQRLNTNCPFLSYFSYEIDRLRKIARATVSSIGKDNVLSPVEDIVPEADWAAPLPPWSLWCLWKQSPKTLLTFATIIARVIYFINSLLVILLPRLFPQTNSNTRKFLFAESFIVCKKVCHLKKYKITQHDLAPIWKSVPSTL